MDEIVTRAVNLATEARTIAYAPYSGFSVGAAVVCDSNQVFSGCNVENAASPIGICAEAAAITTMVRAGSRSINHVVVIGGRVGQDPTFCSPCGSCRQMIFEFSNVDTIVHYISKDGNFVGKRITELLPETFKL